MNVQDIVDLLSDDEDERLDVASIKLEWNCVEGTMLHRKQDSEIKKSSNVPSTGQSSNSVLEQGQSPMDDTGISSSSSTCPAPLCRQFWKAGNYEDELSSKIALQNGKNFLHVHPMFLHSNATSHKWAFGAVAELLDNAFDEIQKGATFVNVDKIINPRDGTPALLIQDDGGGMDPEAMRCCMSFGFSDKNPKTAIGQYGNGFKTSSMRLGADVIVFSCHEARRSRTVTQSICLLSYTFLTRTCHDRIVVPMVDYELDTSTGTLKALHGREHFMSNLSLLLQWSPYSSKAELLKQFDGIGLHGTKIMIYNLWFSDDGNMELDFDSDPEDIRIGGDIINKFDSGAHFRPLHEQHIANRFHFSLRGYLSILYLRIPESFSIMLRGKVVRHHNVANDLKYPEYILYRPQTGGCVEGTVVTTIGFLKDAPNVCIHGFNIYHKNRLVLPYWPVVSYSYRDSRGRGVTGVLEANFIEPTHNKQDFERTSLFQKLETRLKEMTWEYWDLHCALLGYQPKKKPHISVSPPTPSHSTPYGGVHQPIVLNQSSTAAGTMETPRSAPCQLAAENVSVIDIVQQLVPNSGGAIGRRSHKRKEWTDSLETEKVKMQAIKGINVIDGGQSLKTQRDITTTNQLRNPQTTILMQENKKLHAQCEEYEKRMVELHQKVIQLRSELGGYNCEYEQLMAERKALDAVKNEKRM